MPLSQLFLECVEEAIKKHDYIYKIHLRWSVKTLEIFSLYLCQLNKS